MKTPKEKAQELVNKFYNDLPQWVNKSDAIRCAKITVDEMLSVLDPIEESETTYGFRDFYEKVKQELEKM